MVLGVCTRVLGGVHDAEDAFQATFLVLVRKASSIRAPGSLGPWLYGVAYRTALKAKAQALKRQKLEKPLVDVAAPAVGDRVILDDLRAVLDEEVNCLPAKYRVPFVLCYLQGKTNAQAAKMLGCAQGTIFSRLARARERLQKRLGRRLAIPSGVFALLLTQSTVSEAVPVSYSLSTSKAALAFAAGKAAVAGTSSAPAAALAEGVLRAMFLTKLKIAIVMFLAIGTAGTAVGFLTHRALVPQPGSGEIAGEARSDKDKLRGTWIPVAVTKDGTEFSEEDIKAKNFKMVITAEKLTLPNPDDPQDVAYKLDSAKKPKQIDLLLKDGTTAKGIYSLEGTRLKFCLEKVGGERPTAFAAPEGSKHLLIVFKRKPEP
ncbi:MAG TPA: sigma-70 family RNA polymerase sigma factor [Gemmataceae bacterium]|nr:sigma-70 family RNA polymerase sigma factor [Gemmataceae bacterium]